MKSRMYIGDYLNGFIVPTTERVVDGEERTFARIGRKWVPAWHDGDGIYYVAL